MEFIDPNTPVTSEDADKGITKEGAIGLALGLFLLAAAYLIICIFPVMGSPLGFLIITASVYAAVTAAALLMGAKLDFFSIAALILGVVAALYRMIHGCVTFDLTPILVIEGLLYAYYVVSLFSNHSKSIGGGLLLDLIKGIAYMFVSFHEFFVSIFKPKGSRKKPYAILLTIGGLLLTALVVIIVVSLLSYDEHFMELIPKIEIDDVFLTVLKISVAVPLAAMMFGVFASSRKRMLPTLSEKDTVSRVGAKVKVIPAILIVMPIAALLIVYVLFFISQWAYYMSAFTHTLPEGYSAAEYAREGFFQLCGVTFINLVLIAAAGCFMRNRTGGADAVRRIVMILLSAASLILIATAISKMLLYIDRFDLTSARLGATVFMLFLTVVFMAVIVSAIFKKVKVLPVVVTAAALFFCAYSLFNTNRFIAKYNVDMYLCGKHDSVDVEYLFRDLGWSAVPELKRLADNAEGEVKEKAQDALTGFRSCAGDVEWYQGEIPFYIAEDVLND